ncbi:MAG: NAD(P)/FAD-dependent oxidoreductase [Spirochaetales bacterium]|nr:NAD(P)/FAD-dependent oxidoreductase [Spirochaetales bacterium]
MNRKIIIIGGGLAGLSAGIYARLQGYECEIYESHSLPGGVCTSWTRKGYTFDGAFHWWLGSIPESPFYPLFEQTGIFPGTEVIHREVFTVLRSENGEEFPIPSKMEQFRPKLLAIAPEDSEEIEYFFKTIEKFRNISLPMDKPFEAYKLRDFLKMPKELRQAAGLMKKYRNMSIAEYTERFSNGQLRATLSSVLPSFAPAFTLLSFFGFFDTGDGNFPKGAALKFVRRMEKKYLDLGGKISYNSRVKKILVEKNKAIGIELENGETHHADRVLSAADGHSTIYDMLGGRFTNKKIDTLYRKNKIFDPLVQVSFGINADLSEYPHCYSLAKKEKAGEAVIHRFGIRHYCYDDSLAPKNKSVAIALIGTSLELWEKASADRKQYETLKQQYADAALRAIESVYPKVHGKVEVTDVATPMTTIRYTSNWKGSYEGWLPNIENLSKSIPKTLPGLKNFRMAGQWTEPGGGIPAAVMSGRNAIYMISLKDRAPWQV